MEEPQIHKCDFTTGKHLIMVKLPRLNAKDLVALVEKRGFKIVRQSGSHRIFKNDSGIRLTIPFHTSKILHPKIIKQIFRDANL